MIFIDSKKSDKICWDLYSTNHVDAMKRIFMIVWSLVLKLWGVSNKFLRSIGLHQGSTLHPYIFILVMDERTNLIVKVDESLNEINYKPEFCR